jgi:hypothetical protein
VEFPFRAMRFEEKEITGLRGLFRQHCSILSTDVQDLTIIDTLLARSHGAEDYPGNQESVSLRLLPSFFDHGFGAAYTNRWLQKAAERGFLQRINLLIDNKADLLACIADGKTALDIARANLVEAAQQKQPIFDHYGVNFEKWKKCLDVVYFLEHGSILTVEEYYMKGLMIQEEAACLSRTFRTKYEAIRIRELMAKNRERQRDRSKVKEGSQWSTRLQ